MMRLVYSPKAKKTDICRSHKINLCIQSSLVVRASGPQKSLLPTKSRHCIVVAASADFVSDISSDELEAAVTEINGAIKSVDDRIKRVFVEAEPPENHTLERTSS